MTEDSWSKKLMKSFIQAPSSYIGVWTNGILDWDALNKIGSKELGWDTTGEFMILMSQRLNEMDDDV